MRLYVISLLWSENRRTPLGQSAYNVACSGKCTELSYNQSVSSAPGVHTYPETGVRNLLSPLVEMRGDRRSNLHWWYETKSEWESIYVHLAEICLKKLEQAFRLVDPSMRLARQDSVNGIIQLEDGSMHFRWLSYNDVIFWRRSRQSRRYLAVPKEQERVSKSWEVYRDWFVTDCRANTCRFLSIHAKHQLRQYMIGPIGPSKIRYCPLEAWVGYNAVFWTGH